MISKAEKLEDELTEVIEDKTKLKEKVDSLLDVLYGCPECGYNSCECDLSLEEASPEPEPPFPPPETLSAPLLPPSSSGSPWTPPPTPPCISCGGINYGPSLFDFCFNCIPPLEIKSQDSPSRTPPGTPPQRAAINPIRPRAQDSKKHDQMSDN